MKRELKKYLDNLKSCTIIKSSAGGGAGSIILIELNNNTGVFNTLWIECAWRIENKNKVVATSADNIEAVTGLIARSVKMLEGKIIDSIKLTPFYDLCIKFTDGFCLRTFCVFSYDYEFDGNWYLAIPEWDLTYEITKHFKIKKGKYNSND
jgi:hypothetical protein